MATNPSPTGTGPSLVDRARNIILQPKAEWPIIDAEPATIGGLYRNYVAILAAIPAVCAAVGMLVFGVSLFFVTWRPGVGYVLSNAIVRYVMGLVAIYVLALIIEALAPTFGGTKDRVQAFKLAAYSYTPAWVAGVLMLLPALAPLAALIGLYSFYLLFVGLPILMKSSRDKTGIYLAAIVVAAIILYLVIGMVVAAVSGAFMPSITTPGYTFPR